MSIVYEGGLSGAKSGDAQAAGSRDQTCRAVLPGPAVRPSLASAPYPWRILSQPPANLRRFSYWRRNGRSKADATFAADHVEVDWNEEAAEAAKNYLEMTPFSRDGLIQQLTSAAGDGFTQKQAVYGVDQAGL